jgi:hypothetical protein
MENTISKDMLKSALIELAQSDREFFVSIISDLLPQNGRKTAKKPISEPKIEEKTNPPLEKITPPYRKNVEEMRAKYAMDINVLRKLEELFKDAPSVEEFLQIKNS